MTPALLELVYKVLIGIIALILLGGIAIFIAASIPGKKG